MNDVEAIKIVARHVASSVRYRLDDMWEDYPDIGEHDWERVAHEASLLLVVPPFSRDMDAALALLASRAEMTEV